MAGAPAPLVAGCLVALCALVWAAASDIRRYIIPNRASLLLCAAYASGLFWMTPGAWLAGLATGAAAFAIGLLLFARGWVGGGDVKLAAAIALWAGPGFLSDFALVTSLAGVLLAVVMLSPLRALLPRRQGEAAEGLRQSMPFGAPLAAGGVWVLALQLAAHA